MELSHRDVAAQLGRRYMRCMTMLTVTEQHQPPAARTERPRKPTAKVQQAIRLMIEEGIRYAEAAERVGMHVRAMRKALEQQHVVNYLRTQRQVFRAATCAANDLRLAQVRDTSGNAMAIVAAVKALERIDDSQTSSAARMQAPGLVLVIQQQAAQPVVDRQPTNAANMRTIEHEQDQGHE